MAISQHRKTSPVLPTTAATTMDPPTPPCITLYTGQTPNGIKVSIALAELGLPYTARKIDMATNEQKTDWFTAINPNGRIPALIDIHSDGKEIRIFESGSIMQYLVDRYDTEHKISYPSGSREAVETTVRPSPSSFWILG